MRWFAKKPKKHEANVEALLTSIDQSLKQLLATQASGSGPGRWNELMASLAELQEADDQLANQVGLIINALGELRSVVGDLEAQLEAEASPEELQPIVDSLKARAAAIEAALTPTMPTTPEELPLPEVPIDPDDLPHVEHH